MPFVLFGLVRRECRFLRAAQVLLGFCVSFWVDLCGLSCVWFMMHVCVGRAHNCSASCESCVDRTQNGCRAHNISASRWMCTWRCVFFFMVCGVLFGACVHVSHCMCFGKVKECLRYVSVLFCFCPGFPHAHLPARAYARALALVVRHGCACTH